MSSLLLTTSRLLLPFFVEIGMELEGEAPVEGRWVDRVVGLDDVRQNVAMMCPPPGPLR
jgi:hypothetical protein